MSLQFASSMRQKFEEVVMVDFFVSGLGKKARLIKNQQNMKNGCQFLLSLTTLYKLALI